MAPKMAQGFRTARVSVWPITHRCVRGDGDTDLLSASVNDDKLAWYANDGSGNFGAQQVISATADHISHVTTADLDGDGDQDIIMVSRTPPPYSWTGDIVW
ncbi:MAG: VCBS repeat-containing protein, partial [Flavobacteriales bacterium]|nr:VCBS repeat-containing protein [Flavobacteriales bacterium]